MAIPDKIKVHKPDINRYGATEIRCIKNHFYVYEISSKWDAQKPHNANTVFITLSSFFGLVQCTLNLAKSLSIFIHHYLRYFLPN